MTWWEWAIAGLTIWTLLSVGVGLVIGKSFARAWEDAYPQVRDWTP